MIILVLIGFFIGVAMTAPVGSVNIMCLRKALNDGFFSGLLTAIGAVLADALFASIAVFGVGYVSVLVQQHAFWLQLVGGFVVLLFGMSILKTKKPVPDKMAQQKPHLGGPVLAFLLTITNPGTVFGFIAFFSAMGKYVPPPQDLSGALFLLIGVVLGCLGWWCVVAGAASYYRQKISQNLLAKINKATGLFMLVFGSVLIIRVLIKNIEALI